MQLIEALLYCYIHLYFVNDDSNEKRTAKTEREGKQTKLSQNAIVIMLTNCVKLNFLQRKLVPKRTKQVQFQYIESFTYYVRMIWQS
jgi:hypothetical protein